MPSISFRRPLRAALGTLTALIISIAPLAAQQAPLTFDQAVPTTTGTTPTTPAYGQPPQGGPPAMTALPAAGNPAAFTPLPGTTAQPGVGPVPGAATAPTPPFVLTDVEASFVFQTLKMWEDSSSKIETFKADFQRLEYDEVWNPGSTRPMIISEGVLSYAKPDRGSFKISKISRWVKTDPDNPAPDAPADLVEQKDEIGEHWVCDGEAVYEYDSFNKQLKVTSIPEEMRGKSIVDGPLPFLFGAEAKKLAERYWIRTKAGKPAEIWLEAFPRWGADAASYDRVEVMLDRKTMQPLAIQVHLPGGRQRHVYTFQSPTINGTMDSLLGSLFSRPRVPLGWKRVDMTSSELPPGSPAPGPTAATPPAGIQR